MIDWYSFYMRTKIRAVFMLPLDVPRSANQFENWSFKFKELKIITNNFSTVNGRGGFGPVYFGCLENGTPVAVKMLSETSSQGYAEFLAEVHVVSHVHLPLKKISICVSDIIQYILPVYELSYPYRRLST